MRAVPFHLTADMLGDLAFYAFTLTRSGINRPVGEYKIQIILPGHERGQSASLDMTVPGYPLIVGWTPVERVFTLWDAFAHPAFAYSRNMQVSADLIILAKIDGLAVGTKPIRGRQTETIVACREDALFDAISSRLTLTADREYRERLLAV
jgi:hypothetical protein